MPIENFKLRRPAVAYPFARATNRPVRTAASHTVPVAEMAFPPSSPTLPPIDHEDIADAAEIARLLAMPFPAFAQTVSALLENLGYTDVAAMKVMHGRGKGRNAHGGYDLRMYLPIRLTRGLVIAQVKQYREAVPRSFVDELRGAMLRLGASQSLLITTSMFSASAIEAAQAAQYAAPVRLMDGQELARLIRHQPQGFASPLAWQTAPACTTNVPAPASTARPQGTQKAEQGEREVCDGQNTPPNDTACGSKAILPGSENVTLTLHFDVCLAPAVTNSIRDRQDGGRDERRRV